MLGYLRIILGPFRDYVGIILRAFWNNFGDIVGSFWILLCFRRFFMGFAMFFVRVLSKMGMLIAAPVSAAPASELSKKT